jgi:glyoxylase-like metal-dependent hydrolase (beta-lactamase superfamily II)
MKLIVVMALAIFTPAMALAAELKVHPVVAGVWAIEGPAVQRNPDNLANNATFGLIETTDGAVLVDPGGTFDGAKALHDVVKSLTDQPVRIVINTGGQDHRWLGNGYWKDEGATVIASEDAVADHKERGSLQLSILDQLVGAALGDTEPVYADETFSEAYDIDLGGRRIEIRHPAAAHTPGDSFVWLPEERVVFTGDIVYVGRVLGVLDFSDSAAWLEAFAAIEELNPEHVVPGHGPLTTLATAQADTRDYLLNLRTRIRDHIDNGGDIIASVEVDQSAFSYLDQFDSLARRNAQTVFQQMEWE